MSTLFNLICGERINAKHPQDIIIPSDTSKMTTNGKVHQALLKAGVALHCVATQRGDSEILVLGDGDRKFGRILGRSYASVVFGSVTMITGIFFLAISARIAQSPLTPTPFPISQDPFFWMSCGSCILGTSLLVGAGVGDYSLSRHQKKSITEHQAKALLESFETARQEKVKPSTTRP